MGMEPKFSIDTWYRIGHALLTQKKSKRLFQKFVLKNLPKDDIKILLIDNNRLDDESINTFCNLGSFFTSEEIFYLQNFDVDHHDFHSEKVYALLYASSLIRNCDGDSSTKKEEKPRLSFILSLAMVDVEKLIPTNRAIKIWVDLFNKYPSLKTITSTNPIVP
jgi:hypothetical protein